VEVVEAERREGEDSAGAEGMGETEGLRKNENTRKGDEECGEVA
jgi:hypothetical protein